HCRLNNTSPSIRFLLHAYLQSKAPDKNIVIFTHNHCLTYIAKDKRDATFKPDYLDGLVMHVEKGKVYLDGEFVNH
ncbi:hypothetical protein RNP22_17685, partial [Escherichia coli]|nr:hypothetical protein [Escherichia coli]NPN24484.1 hypothetical protein [Escherichia coli]